MKTKEEVNKKVEEIMNEISTLFNDPDISDSGLKNSALKIAGYTIYLVCPELSDFDEMITFIKQDYLIIKSERG